ncbi:hypothetical protein BWO91_17680 [Plantibacter flavus]|nr:hypothetical protein BWO91_17680 [Plantibacter flavus]
MLGGRAFGAVPDVEIHRSVALARMALWGTIVVGIAAMIMSVAAQIEIAEWMMLQAPVTWLLPVVIDGSIVVLSVVATHQRANGRSTRLSWMAVAFYSVVSVVVNALHVITEFPSIEERWGLLQMIVGAVIAAVMPLTIYIVTHSMIGMLVEPPISTSDSRVEVVTRDDARPAVLEASARRPGELPADRPRQASREMDPEFEKRFNASFAPTESSRRSEVGE